MAYTPLTNIQWLRKLLEDEPRYLNETAVASGAERIFFLNNPPVSEGTSRVFVNGEPKTEGVDYTVEEERRISFSVSPEKDALIQIEYARLTWTDNELAFYLERGEDKWTTPVTVTYQALIYAVDSILMGVTVGQNFGSGDEKYDVVSVFDRLLKRRELAEALLEKEADEPFLQVFDIIYDADDPEYPGNWEDRGALFNQIGYWPAGPFR